jgi:hypothetical protein
MSIPSGEIGNGVEYEFIPQTIEGSDEIVGELEFSSPIEPQYVTTPEFVDFIDTDWPSDVAKIRICSGEKTSENIALRVDGERGRIPVLSAPVYYAVNHVLSGDIEKAEEVIEELYSYKAKWGFRGDCRDTLQFEKFVELMDTVAGTDESFLHIQFRSALGYFAKRIGDDIPQGIHSFETLRERVEMWNEADNLEQIALPEVLGEKLGRNWFRGDGLSTERQELIDIGFDPIEYDSDWNTPLPACWIAHTVLTEGVEEAKEYVQDRPTPEVEDYEATKSEAEGLREKRGAGWGKVVALTEDDFLYDAQSYLYWTGRDYYRRDEYQGKAKIQPLLFAGAKKLCPEHVPDRHKQNIEFHEKDAIGHEWRRDGDKDRSIEAFREAKKIASGEGYAEYEARPRLIIEAESSIVHMEASRLSDNSDSEECISRYEKGIEDIVEIGNKHDISDELIVNKVNFLQRRKREFIS